jgi:hypothetical protein
MRLDKLFEKESNIDLLGISIQSIVEKQMEFWKEQMKNEPSLRALIDIALQTEK